jgi:hypothetical protein
MFTDLFNLVKSLDHDFQEQDGQQVHACGCRRCAINLRLVTFKGQILRLLRDLDFGTGEPTEKK